MFEACRCCSFFPPIYSALRSPFTAQKVVSPAHRRTASTRQQSNHYKWIGNGRPFVFVLSFSFQWYRILGIRLHISPDRNCLLLPGELLVFHFKSDFTFRGRGGGRCSGGKGRQVRDQSFHMRCKRRTLMTNPEIRHRGLPGTQKRCKHSRHVKNVCSV